MTDNQEKELFTTLASLVTGVNKIQSDIQVLTTGFQDLKTDVQVLKTDVKEIKETQRKDSQLLERLDAKTDTIAEVVVANDKRLTAVEKDVADLRDTVH